MVFFQVRGQILPIANQARPTTEQENLKEQSEQKIDILLFFNHDFEIRAAIGEMGCSLTLGKSFPNEIRIERCQQNGRRFLENTSIPNKFENFCSLMFSKLSRMLWFETYAVIEIISMLVGIFFAEALFLNKIIILFALSGSVPKNLLKMNSWNNVKLLIKHFDNPFWRRLAFIMMIHSGKNLPLLTKRCWQRHFPKSP